VERHPLVDLAVGCGSPVLELLKLLSLTSSGAACRAVGPTGGVNPQNTGGVKGARAKRHHTLRIATADCQSEVGVHMWGEYFTIAPFTFPVFYGWLACVHESTIARTPDLVTRDK
jgi:hypothetical protein